MGSATNNTDRSHVESLLTGDMHPLWRKVEGPVIYDLTTEFLQWDGSTGGSGHAGMDRSERLVRFIIHRINEQLERVHRLRWDYNQFSRRYSSAATAEEKKTHILAFARVLGASARTLRGDKRSFSRWFGHDTVSERYMRRMSESEWTIGLYLKYLGYTAEHALRIHSDGERGGKRWRRLELDTLARKLLTYDGDNRVRIETFKCISRALKALPDEGREGGLEQNLIQYVYRSALFRREHVWIQCEALTLLESLDPRSMKRAIRDRLINKGEGDDLFVRRRCVMLLGRNLKRYPELSNLLARVLCDPSPYVRQAVCQVLTYAEKTDIQQWLPRLVKEDDSLHVRAAAVRAVVSLLSRDELRPFLVTLINELLTEEKEEFVLRVGLHVCDEGLDVLSSAGDDDDRAAWYENVLEVIETLHCETESLAVRRWAAMTRERMWLRTTPAAQDLKQSLEKIGAGIKPGSSRKLSRKLIKHVPGQFAGRVLAVLTQRDFGIDAQWGCRQGSIVRDYKKGFRLWRLLHEMRTPATDKRQAVSHTTGRCLSGNVRAPSSIMNELTETKVPGEPLYMSGEAGWRPYVPLVDDVVGSLERGVLRKDPVNIFTSEGITTIRPPSSLVGRLNALIKLNWRFKTYARLRNWKEGSQRSPSSYVEALCDLGFEITLKPYRENDKVTSLDPAAKRFFNKASPAAGFGFMVPGNDIVSSLFESDLWMRMKEYFFSAYQNSLYDLGVFAGALVVLFAGRNIYLKQSFRKARHDLPLVIGGWGTRGKSSVERLKAGLLSSLGYGVFSKTTGCEAMFLHGHPYSRLHELFLFRPYDKATIWEQFNVVRMATKLKTHVFLWECMGLTPEYVDILQHEWMHDDLSTITNTYPDHEDVQGPSGMDIARTIATFIPRRGTMVTSEENLLPILQDEADRLGTHVRSISWLDAGLIPDDILGRFGYEEHPYNVALVQGLAKELGINSDYALKEMADNVIADIGVLKLFPSAKVNSRRLEFANGMSANERFACLSNWRRLGFDKHDPDEGPGTWITAVVNNRADRVPRSRVFAGILAEDIAVDCIVLIGSNLSGLMGFISEAWENYAQRLSLWPDGPDSSGKGPEQVLEDAAKRLRIASTEEQVTARLKGMLEGINGVDDCEVLSHLWNDGAGLAQRLNESGRADVSEAVVAHLQRDCRTREQYQSFLKRLKNMDIMDREETDRAFRSLLGEWFQEKIIVISNYHATGNQVIQRIADKTPPGYLNRIMGLQNIKGTGLDFVYSWQKWERCHRACTQLLSNDGAQIEQGLRMLSAFQDYGVLSEEFVRETVEVVKHSAEAQTEKIQAELIMIGSNLDNAMADVHAQLSAEFSSGWPLKLIEAFESILDAGDAIKRRKTANKIYKDLVDERISHERAVVELQALNKRQKGGWLFSRFSELTMRLKKHMVKSAMGK